jgi:hypothetical protein
LREDVTISLYLNKDVTAVFCINHQLSVKSVKTLITMEKKDNKPSPKPQKPEVADKDKFQIP